MTMRFDQVADLVKIIDASACDDFVLETADLKLVLRRRGAGSATPSGGSAGLGSALEPPPVPSPGPAPATQAAPSAPQPVASGRNQVRAPMVGTFYRSPSPDAPPFVEVGSEVTAGQPLCVIEVMKLFTTIYAEVAGRIVQVNADNAELVEYGRVLFVME